MKSEVLHGNCLDVMRQMESNSVDAIVTDPPYGLSFMGKKWDYDVPSTEIWEEALRVLKPGGYLLAFAGTRTQHRMAVRIEDAGFEIRDMIAWVYGSGFPKSLNIGKAVDKLLGNEREVVGKKSIDGGWHHEHTINDDNWIGSDQRITKGSSDFEGFGTALKPAWESITVAQKSVQCSTDIGNLYVSLIKQIKSELCKYQSFAKTAEKNLKLRSLGSKEDVNIAQWIVCESINIQEDLFVLMDMLQSELEMTSSWSIALLWLNILADHYCLTNTFTTEIELSATIELKILNSMEWENIFQNIMQAKGSQISGLNANAWNAESIFNVLKLKSTAIREHFAQEVAMLMENETDFAPNLKPVILSRKPLSEKTVAENCLKWGVGGIDIDGSRVELNGDYKCKANGRPSQTGLGDNYDPEVANMRDSIGRFPANLIHDGSDEVVSLFPSKAGAAAPVKKGMNGDSNGIYGDFAQKGDNGATFYGDQGSAARFFYCAKSSRSERGSSNNHPTVKPIALMEYLVKLVCRKGAIVLDPFAGSGTTAIACKNTDRQFIVIERDLSSIEIINQRLSEVKEPIQQIYQPTLFD